MNELMSKIGQLFVLGFPGEHPPKPFLSFIAEQNIGGVILFGDNCHTHQSARENIEAIKREVSTPLIAIDQEGGSVCRLKGAPVEYRAAAAYGRENNVEHFREEYTRAAVLMESLGINLNLAPVADIFLNLANTCLAGRCFGNTPEQVAEFVRTSVTVSRECGLLSCLKHFPGLGTAVIDPHEATAQASFDQVIFAQREIIPFRAGVEAGASMIMTTHLLLPKFDSQIVTGSAEIINRYLRGVLGFDGIIITDELGMSGADVLGNLGQRTVAAFKAGHDLLLLGQNYEAAIEAYQYFADCVKRGEISPARIHASLDRIAGIKFGLTQSVIG